MPSALKIDKSILDDFGDEPPAPGRRSGGGVGLSDFGGSSSGGGGLSISTGGRSGGGGGRAVGSPFASSPTRGGGGGGGGSHVAFNDGYGSHSHSHSVHSTSRQAPKPWRLEQYGNDRNRFLDPRTKYVYEKGAGGRITMVGDAQSGGGYRSMTKWGEGFFGHLDAYLKKNQARLGELFNQFDVDYNDRLDRKEMGRLIKEVMPVAEPHEVEYFQAMMDANGDGSVTYDELIKSIKACRDIDASVRAAGAGGGGSAEVLLERLGGAVKGDLVRAEDLFRRFDERNRGTLAAPGLLCLVSELMPSFSSAEKRVLVARLQLVAPRGEMAFQDFLIAAHALDPSFEGMTPHAHAGAGSSGRDFDSLRPSPRHGDRDGADHRRRNGHGSHGHGHGHGNSHGFYHDEHGRDRSPRYFDDRRGSPPRGRDRYDSRDSRDFDRGQDVKSRDYDRSHRRDHSRSSRYSDDSDGGYSDHSDGGRRGGRGGRRSSRRGGRSTAREEELEMEVADLTERVEMLAAVLLQHEDLIEMMCGQMGASPDMMMSMGAGGMHNVVATSRPVVGAAGRRVGAAGARVAVARPLGRGRPQGALSRPASAPHTRASGGVGLGGRGGARRALAGGHFDDDDGFRGGGARRAAAGGRTRAGARGPRPAADSGMSWPYNFPGPLDLPR